MILGTLKMRSLYISPASRVLQELSGSLEATFLNRPAVKGTLNTEIAQVIDLSFRHDCWTNGTRPIEAFGIAPLTITELRLSGGDIVRRSETGGMSELGYLPRQLPKMAERTRTSNPGHPVRIHPCRSCL